MGSIRFERQPPLEGSTKNIIEFDSSYDRAVTRVHGWEEGTCELNLVYEDEHKRVWELYARGFGETKATKRGLLSALTRDEAWARSNGGIHYGRDW